MRETNAEKTTDPADGRIDALAAEFNRANLVGENSRRLAAEPDHDKTVEAFHGAPVPMGLATIDLDGVHLSSVNAACCRLLGYETSELLGRNVGDLVVKSDCDRVIALARRTIDGGAAAGSFETQLLRADGSTVPVWVHSSILETDAGEPTTILTHVIDLTERKRIEGEGERARQWTESLAEVRAAALDELPLDEILAVVCRRARLMTGADLAFVSSVPAGTDRHRVIAADPTHAGHRLPESFEVDAKARRALAGETTGLSDFDPLDEVDEVDGADGGSNGVPATTAMDGIVVRIAGNGDPALLFVLSEDHDGFDGPRITVVEALAAEAGTALELVRARRERSRLVLLEDRERMAHDFHDLVIQRLFAAGMSLHAVQSLTIHEEASCRVGQVIAEIDQAIAELRSTIFRLTADPPVTPARRLADIVVRARAWMGFEPSLRFEGDGDAVSEPVLEQMIPTLTEMLSNAARHAEAGRVEVTITIGERRTTLNVTDDGVGFDPDTVDRSGLANLVSRAHRLGGCATVDTQPGRGTSITWSVPT